MKDFNLDQKVEALNKTAVRREVQNIQSKARQLSDMSLCI